MPVLDVDEDSIHGIFVRHIPHNADPSRRVGLPPPLPTISQWPACQVIGEQLHRDGYQAILVSSAARPQHRNLVVFRDAHEIAGCKPQAQPTPINNVPPVPRGMRT